MGTTRTRRKVKSKVGSLWIPGINCLLYFIDAPKTNLSESNEKPRTHREHPRGACGSWFIKNRPKLFPSVREAASDFVTFEAFK